MSLYFRRLSVLQNARMPEHFQIMPEYDFLHLIMPEFSCTEIFLQSLFLKLNRLSNGGRDREV